jgi:threonine aldolase
MNFTSDNAAGIAPEIMEAMVRANSGMAASYGADEITARLKKRFAEVFEREVEVFPVVSGTAANALSLAAITPSYGAVLCHELAHVHTDECGAPEMYSGGAKLVPVSGAGAKIDPDALSAAQSTELGTVYSIDEIGALAEIARGRKLDLHMDGARFANALAHLGCSPAELTWKAGVDIMSFGATKNGAMAAEAVIVFSRGLARDISFRRKRGGHLLSKMRFISAQLDAYLEGGLWLRLAAHANAMTARLAAGLAVVPGVELLVQPQANELFPRLPVTAIRRLRESGALFHPWPMPGDSAEAQTVRLVTSFQTEAAEIDRFLALLKG